MQILTSFVTSLVIVSHKHLTLVCAIPQQLPSIIDLHTMTNPIIEANNLLTHKDLRMIWEHPPPPASCIAQQLTKTASTVSTMLAGGLA